MRCAERYFAKHDVPAGKFRFLEAFAEKLPFEDESFDAMISFDVWEHVQDVACATREAFRVLRPGGLALIVFPSYFHPTQHHLFEATYAPCVHWCFAPATLMSAYWEILNDNPLHRDSIGVVQRDLEPWEKLRTINGTTQASFEKILRNMNWASAEFVRLPFGIAGTAVQRRPALKYLKWVTGPMARIPVLSEVANQRVVCMLRK